MLKLTPTPKKPLSLGWAVFVVALCNTLIFVSPLVNFIDKTLEPSAFWMALPVVIGLHLWLGWLMAALLALGGVMVFRIGVVLLGYINVGALYFITQYHIILDRTMMGNVFNTKWEEAQTLFHFKMLGWLLLACVIGVGVFRYPVRANRWWHRVVALGVGVGMGVGGLYLNARSWLWVDAHSKVIGGLILPASYVINTWRYWQSQRPVEVTLLPAIDPTPPTPHPSFGDFGFR